MQTNNNHNNKVKSHLFQTRTVMEMIRVFFRNNDYFRAYELSKQLALYLSTNSTGYYAHYELEDLVAKISEKTVEKIICSKSIKKEKVLHIVSEAYKTGGHTKLMANWIKFDSENEHDIVSTWMTQEDLDDTLKFYDLKNENFTLTGSDFERAEQLYKIAVQYKKIVLHIHMHDLIPILAFSEVEVPTVYFMNHADHCFWTGVSIIDILIQIKESNILLDMRRRGIDSSRQVFLPIPININDFIQKNEDSDRINILITAHPSKIRPTGEKNLILSLIPVLNANPQAIAHFAGTSYKDDFTIEHTQIIYYGPLVQNDLTILEDSCNICLEPFPFSSYTAMLQVAVKGKPIHLAYDPPDSMVFIKDIQGFETANNLKDWQANLNELINDSDARLNLAQKQYRHIQNVYQLKNWKAILQSIYEMKVLIHTRPSKDHYSYGTSEEYLDSFLPHMQPNFKSYMRLLGLSKIITNPTLMYRILQNLKINKKMI